MKFVLRPDLTLHFKFSDEYPRSFNLGFPRRVHGKVWSATT